MLSNLIIDPQSSRLRSGWRVLVFLAVFTLPWFLLSIFTGPGERRASLTSEITPSMIINYSVLVAWILIVSWGCLILFEEKGPSSLGLGFTPGWRGEIGRGVANGGAMIAGIVALQILSGGTRLSLNKFWWHAGVPEGTAFRHVLTESLLAILFMIIAALFEELLYRGYAFQTLLRGVSPVVPLLLYSILFGYGHWNNPNRTTFSTANTILAGIWLSLAYMTRRNLWYPVALHTTWNVALGLVFGLPVSGNLIPPHTFLTASSGAPVWLTGGNYGSEGGASATLVLIFAIVALLRKGVAHLGLVRRREAGDGVEVSR